MQNLRTNKFFLFAISAIFFLSFLLSTGAFIDYLIIGTEGRYSKVSDDGGYRFVLWLPLYGLMALVVLLRIREVFFFLKEYIGILILFIYVVFSAIWSDFPFETLYSSLQLLLISFFAISCSSLFSVRYIFSMIYSVFSLIVFFSFVFVIFIPDYGIDIFNGESSFRGVFVEKNRLGQILAYYFALSFFFIRWKFFSVAVFFMALFLLVGNRSMTALLLTISIPFIIFIARFFIGNNKNIYINTVTISFFSIFVFTIFLVNYYDLLNFLGKDPTLTGRTEIWELGVYAFLDRPLFGYGYSSFWSSNSPHGGQFIQWSLVWGPSSMHNGWFEILLQLGLIGLVLYLFFFLMALKLTVYYLNSGSSRKLGKSLFVLFFMIIFWSLMQHNLLRHQAFSHYMLLILFSSIFFYKRCK